MEHPDKKSGLPLTEKLILNALKKESLSPGKLFAAYQKLEQAEFMGDMTFWIKLNQMAFCDFPLLDFKVKERVKYPIDPEQEISLSLYGNKCLVGDANWFGDNKLEKYVGGCLLVS